jgi:bla regulator protein BlaR1
METIILKIILCSGIVLGLYYLFLAKEKTLTFNRFYLLVGLIFSYSIPFVSIETKEIVKDKPVLLIEQETPIQILQDSATVQVETLDYAQLLLIIYFVISGILIAKMLYSIIRIKTLKGKKIIYQNRNLVLLEKEIAPFSFLSTIYLSEKYFKDQKIDERIFLHEEIHVKQKHSFDVLLIEVVKAFSWFNPFIYFYKNVMITNHEFLADEVVITQKENIKNYQELILNELLKQQNLPLTHQFNFNNTKKRFIMMTKRNSKFAEAKKYLAIPLFIILAGFFVEKVYAKDSLPKISGKSESILAEEDPYTEFNKILSKYAVLFQNKKFAELDKTITPDERKRLSELYNQLNAQQKNEAPIVFYQAKKSPKIIPTAKQMSDFLNEKNYGLWIDGKKTKNSNLKNYKSSDFSNVSISKIFKNAISSKNPQPYQVSLMTNSYYQKYADSEDLMMLGFKTDAIQAPLSKNNLRNDTISPRKNVDAKLTEVNSQNSDSQIKSARGIGATPEINQKQEVTTFPEYPGGINAMRNKISQNFNGAVLKGDEGIVRSNITFTIDEKGEVSNVKTMGSNEAFNNEAYRVVKLANENITWKPATKDGNNVAYRFQIPLTMKFEASKKTQ